MPMSRLRRFRPLLFRLEDRTAPAAGMLDPTFGVGGVVTTRIASQSSEVAQDTAIDNLGRIVIAGYIQNGANYDFAVARFTSAGVLDSTFGQGGVLILPLGPNSTDVAAGIAIDSQDRIVIAGYTGVNSYDFAVIRLTANGVLDSTFDGDGTQTIDFGGANDIGRDVAVDSLDRIVVSGSRNTGIGANTYVLSVCRLTASGALDASFDGDGKQTIDVSGIGESANAVAIDSLGRILLAGELTRFNFLDFVVARLTPNGALDSSFDGDGIVLFSVSSENDNCNAVTVDSLNRVVVAGASSFGSGNNYDFAVARLTDTGALDSSFDADGKQTINFGSNFDQAYDVAIDSLDRIAVVGFISSSNYDMAAARLTSAGSLDLSFSDDGKQTINFGDLFFERAYGMAVDSEDRLVGVGYSTTTPGGLRDDIAVFRLTTAGVLDNGFDVDGKLILALNAQLNASGRAVAIDNLGRIVVAGYTDQDYIGDFAVARYTASGALDSSFGGTGVVTFSFNSIGDAAYAVAIDSLNRVIVAGFTRSAAGYDFAVARLTSAGNFDTSFDVDGKLTVEFGVRETIAYCVAVDSSDRIVVAGQTTVSPQEFAAARLLENGALDPSFGVDGKMTISFGPGAQATNGVTIDSLGRIVLAGEVAGDFALARITATGILDTSFDGDGLLTLNFGSTNDRVLAVAIDSLNRIVVAGYTYPNANGDMAVARLTDAGALDGSFDGDGKQTISFTSGNDIAYAVAVDSLDRILVAGSELSPSSNNDAFVARLTTAGALDVDFDADGKQTIAYGVGTDVAYGIAVDSADRAYVAGYTVDNGRFFALARLTDDTTTAAGQINDGAVQHSRVTSLTVRFSGSVTFSGKPVQAFTLTRIGGGIVTFSANVTFKYGGTVVTLSNFTGPETEFGSLRDGRYTLTALASQISAGGQPLDGDADGTPGGNFVFGDAQGLFRFFGDINGDRRVDIADFGLFSLSYLNAANYVAGFDFNGDGRIDIADFGQFAVRYLAMLP